MKKKEKKTKEVNKPLKNRPLPLIVFAVSVCVLGLCFYLAGGINEFVWNESLNSSLSASKQEAGAIDNVIKTSQLNLQKAADIISTSYYNPNDDTEVIDNLNTIVQKLPFDYYRYFKNGECYEMNGTLSGEDNQTIIMLDANGKKGMTDVFTDAKTSKKVIGFYSPIKNNDLISGVAGYMTLETFTENTDFANLNNGKTACVVDKDGNIVIGYISENSEFSNFYNYLNSESNDKSIISLIKKDANKNNDGAEKINLSNSDAIVTYCNVNAFNSWQYLNIHSESDIVKSTNSIVYQIALIGVMICVLLIGVFAYLWFMREKYDKNLSIIETTDMLTGSSNFQKFKEDVNEVIQSTKKTKFVIMIVDIKNFEYINDHFGKDLSNDTLKYFSNIIKQIVDRNETYGRISGDRFAVLLKYKNIQEIIDRYNLIYTLMYNFPELKKKNYNIKIKAGIYEIDRENQLSFDEMIDRATIALKSNRENSKENYAVYNEKLRENFVVKAEIESDMEQSLKDGDFKVYYQPKYDIMRNRINGAEALVRWNHSRRGIIGPDDFVPIFESNGFITEVDKYVYVEVCKHMSKLIKLGKRIVPISINVSRVSAIQPNFVKFYVDCKNKYQIADGFIELEFTESFALESYETLRKIITSLKENGIKCTIDDFGSGYSSFSVLKELQMDVIKLDKLFLNRGSSAERDKILLSAMINLGKDFGMKTIQEGVEKPSELKLLRDLGCDSIQGYIYAQPMKDDDFDKFLETGFNGLPISKLREYYDEDDYYPTIDSAKDIMNND